MGISLIAWMHAQAAPGNGKGNGNGNGNGKGSQDPLALVESTLSSVPVAELPARAAELVTDAKNKDREDVAMAAIQFTAKAHPGSIAPVVGSVVRVSVMYGQISEGLRTA